MEPVQRKKSHFYLGTVLLVLSIGQHAFARNTEYVIENSNGVSELRPDIVELIRSRRDVTTDGAATSSAAATASASATAAVSTTAGTTSQADKSPHPNVPVYTEHDNRTTNTTSQPSNPPPTVVTRIPLLGQNGSGILKDQTSKQPTVSDPIVPDDKFTDSIFRETPEKIKAEQNLTNLTYEDHDFYNSSFIGNLTYFNEHWANITKPKPEIHPILSNSHRRATTVKLSFEFPFYGHPVSNMTVATGGFIYTGEHVHNWLAATQYIAPLMANFDTTRSNQSQVKLYDDGEKFTALWENVTLQDASVHINNSFTFAVTMYKNGDIVFAYKTIPIPISEINDLEHPVKVGISDAYVTDRIMFYVRRKTIYEYHRVSFKNHEIVDGTILQLIALPTCHQYSTCDSCINHNTGFNCTWCEAIHKCSSGTDRNKQDWLLRNCDKATIWKAEMCPAEGASGNRTHNDTSTTYFTDNQGDLHDAVIRTNDEMPSVRKAKQPNNDAAKLAANEPEQPKSSAIGGVVAAFVTIALVSSLAAWVLYAFKNPHTRSGQMLIKYRPSQWSWKRGEARYTAATIHM